MSSNGSKPLMSMELLSFVVTAHPLLPSLFLRLFDPGVTVTYPGDYAPISEEFPIGEVLVIFYYVVPSWHPPEVRVTHLGIAEQELISLRFFRFHVRQYTTARGEIHIQQTIRQNPPFATRSLGEGDLGSSGYATNLTSLSPSPALSPASL